MIELKFHTPVFVELALKQEEPKESLEELLQQYKETCNAYRKYVDSKRLAETSWRRTRINEQGEFNGFSNIEILEDRIDVKICHINQREGK